MLFILRHRTQKILISLLHESCIWMESFATFKACLGSKKSLNFSERGSHKSDNCEINYISKGVKISSNLMRNHFQLQNFPLLSTGMSPLKMTRPWPVFIFIKQYSFLLTMKTGYEIVWSQKIPSAFRRSWPIGWMTRGDQWDFTFSINFENQVELFVTFCAFWGRNSAQQNALAFSKVVHYEKIIKIHILNHEYFEP